MKVEYFKSPSEFRQWLEAHHDSCSELWVGFHKKETKKPSVTYPEALDEGLCFGWIDGVRKSVDAGAYTVRFTPRKPRSKWSEININRVRKLIDAKRMHPSGLKAFEGAEDSPRSYSYEQRTAAKLNPASQRQFRANKKAWDFFQSTPPWYQRITAWWIISAKREETQQSRLKTLISCCKQKEAVPGLEGKLPVPKRNKRKQ